MPKEERKEDKTIKRMADLLRQGATLTDLACPVCASPLFRLQNGDLWCARCEKKVIVVKEGEETSKITRSLALEKLEATLLAKVENIQRRMQQEENVEELQKLSNALSELLSSLEKVRKMRKI